MSAPYPPGRLHCEHTMRPGLAMVPILGSYSKRVVQAGDTVYAVSAYPSADCMKCSKCGYTRYYGKIQIRGYLPSPMPHHPPTNRERALDMIERWQRNTVDRM